MDITLFDYSPSIERPPIQWPNGARTAFWIGLNIEYYVPDRPSTSITPSTAGLVPDPLNYGWRDYGPRAGVWRTMSLLDRLGMRASVLLNADVCRYYPQIISEGNKRDWVWLAHGKNNSILQANMDVEQERAYLTELVGDIKRETGKQPKGWLGPALSETFNTPDLLAELGVEYVCDWCNDDQPYPMKVKSGRMISVPYSIEVNDIPVFLNKGMEAEGFAKMIADQFDVLHDEGGKVMAVALHPFLTGLPFRHKHLANALEYVARQKNVWLATSDEIAAWYYEHYYEGARGAVAS